MTATPEMLLPEGFEDWPKAIQGRYLEELHDLYFPVLHWWQKPPSGDPPYMAARDAASGLIEAEIDHPGTVTPKGDSDDDLFLVAIIELAVLYAGLAGKGKTRP